MISPKCPNCDCKLPMRYTPGVNKRKILTLDGIKELSFVGFYRCRKCRFVIEDTKKNLGGDKMWKEFKKKPVIVRAIQFTYETKEMVYNDIKEVKQNVEPSKTKEGSPCLLIPTLEGEMTANIGDWIIEGIKGELYPCKPDIFEKTYEEVLKNG